MAHTYKALGPLEHLPTPTVHEEFLPLLQEELLRKVIALLVVNSTVISWIHSKTFLLTTEAPSTETYFFGYHLF